MQHLEDQRTEAQTNYERELARSLLPFIRCCPGGLTACRAQVLHAADVQALSAAKQQQREAEDKLRELAAALDSARRQVDEQRQAYEGRVARSEDELASMRARTADLAEQNRLLHNQLDAVTLQAIRVQQQQAVRVLGCRGGSFVN
jgi:hypothetical protein